MGPGRPAGTAAAATVARTEGRETCRGPLWPRRPANAAVNRAWVGVHSHVPLPRVVVGRPWCVGPAVRTSGDGGLARRATMTSAAVVVVATTITAIAVFVIVLVPFATGAAVSAIGRARRCGRRRLGRRGRSVGVERRRGSRRPGTVHVNLLQ
jgi:hypothetical protein